MQWIQAGGFFSWSIVALGMTGLFLAAFDAFAKTFSSRSQWTLSVLAAMLLLGLAGTSIGLYEAIGVYQKFPPAQHTAILAKVLGIAFAPLGLASLLAAFHAILLGWNYQRHLTTKIS